jgi:hypothetical protein
VIQDILEPLDEWVFPVYLDQKVQWVLLDHLVEKEEPDLMVSLVPEVTLGPLDLLGQQVGKGVLEDRDLLGPLVLMDFLDHLECLVWMVAEDIQGVQVDLGLLGPREEQVHQDSLVPWGLQDHLELQEVLASLG